MWISVQVLAVPPGTKAAYLVRLRDITQQFNEYRDLASFRLAVQHKLRTPVAHMAMSATLLALTQVPEGLPPEAAEYAAIVQASAQQLSHQIDDLLTYSNPAPAPAETAHATLAAIESTLHQLMRDCAIATYEWCAAIPADERRIPLAPQAIDIILRELVENARKFHPAHTPFIRVTLKDHGAGRVLLRVEDDGRTLAAEQIERIWKPYYQAEAGFSGNVPGLGLGLPLVASLVVGAGGQVRFCNRNPGPGVAVELALPVAA
jgi:signal transduction histidine kinase